MRRQLRMAELRPAGRALAGAFLGLALAALTGCGGSSSTPPPAPVDQTEALAGVWGGSSQSQALGQAGLNGVVTSDGSFRLLSATNEQATGKVAVTGTAVTGTATLLAPNGSTFAGGQAAVEVNLTGTYSGSAVNLTYTGGDSGSLTLGTQTPVTPTDNLTLDAAHLGTYTAGPQFASTGVQETITIQAGASPTQANITAGGDAHGTVQGTVTQVQAGENAFFVQVTYTLNGGKLAEAFEGLGFFLPQAPGSTAPPQLVIILSAANSDDEFAGLFTRTGP